MFTKGSTTIEYARAAAAACAAWVTVAASVAAARSRPITNTPAAPAIVTSAAAIAIRTLRDGVAAGTVADTNAPLTMSGCSSFSAISCADCGRFSRSFSRHSITR